MTVSDDIKPESKGLRALWASPGGSKFRRVIARICYRLYRLGGELTAIVLGLGIALSFFLASALDRQTTDVSFLQPNLQIWFAEVFNGKSADFGRLDVAWLPARDAFVMTAEDVSVLDTNGDVLESFELLRATLKSDASAILRPKLVSADIRGGIVSYVEDAEGEITIGLGPPENVGRLGPVYKNTGQTALGRKMDIGALETISLSDVTLHYQNAISDIDIVARLDRLATSFSSDGTVVYTAAGEVAQDSKPAIFSIGGVTDVELSEIRTKFEILQARPDQIAPIQGRFWEFRGLEAPVDLKGEIDFSRTENLRSASLDLDIGAGQFRVLRNDVPQNLTLQDFRFKSNLEPGKDRMTIEALNLRSKSLSFDATGFFTELGNLNDGDINSSPVFELSMRNINMQAAPTFSKDIKIDRLDLKGEADADSRTLDIERGRLDMFDARFDFETLFQLTDTNKPAALALNAEMTGEIGIQEFVALWPVNAVGGARRWFERAVIEGQINDLDINLNLDGDFFADPVLTSERVQIAFGVANADVRYMETMPPIFGVTGTGTINGNSLSMDTQGGRVENLIAGSARIEIPVLRPKGGDLIITGRGRGNAQDMLQVLNNPPFELATRYGIDPNDIAGTGEVEMKIIRPLLEFFPRERISYEIQGEFEDVKAPFTFGRYDIENGDIAMDVNRDRMLLSGPIDVGPWRADMQWQETFGDNPPPTQYSISGQINADVLDGFGIASRGWFDGVADVTVNATGRGMDVAQARLEANLTNAALSAEKVWMKPEGEAAQLSGTLTRDVETGYDFNDVSLEGEGISMRGDASIATNFKLNSLDLKSLRIDGLVDGQLRVNTQSGKLDVALEGAFLDVSPWTEEAFQTRQSGLDVPLNISAKLERLVLDQEYSLSAAEFAFSHTGKVIEAARLTGTRDEGPLSLDMTTLESSNRQAVISIPDASDALSAFLGLSNTEGGTLSITMELPPAGEEGAYIGEMKVKDFRLIEAPALAQLLSLASLTGLADTLSGGSMQFDRFTVPFTLLGDDVAIRDARLYGPALGMTGDGDIDLDLRVLDFDGTIVPSYTANSILGDIPVLGDLFVREKDGGLFALTYTVSGPFEKTQIAVNPLSALTPGFLRRIFKPERDDVPEDVRTKIEDVAPKPEDDEGEN
ncbi:DUF3971 domain-containing protein [Litorimonas sp. WD9-15]|uniref:YhdP family protein n=1 Tax=Litorimonas sp. WD9-15 TaxID=3418716 RepID=UPI003CFF81CE